MEDSYAHLQRQNVQYVSGSTGDPYEQIRVSVQPTGKRQRSSTTTAVKVVLGLFGAVLLVAVVVAVVAMVQIAELKGKFRNLTCKLPDSESHINTSCSVIHTCLPDAPSAVYTIYPGGRDPGRSAWCEMDTDGGGWTLFQRRQDGSVVFNRTWAVYQRGFGDPAGEFWLGNDDLHRLTADQPSELRVDIWDWEGGHRYARYSIFSVGSASTNYILHVGGYNGTIGDSLAYHNSKPFTTRDRDNDMRSDGNCAAIRGGGGGWWYGGCKFSNLNGRYRQGGVSDPQGLMWWHWPGHSTHYSYKATAMMLRPRH